MASVASALCLLQAFGYLAVPSAEAAAAGYVYDQASSRATPSAQFLMVAPAASSAWAGSGRSSTPAIRLSRAAKAGARAEGALSAGVASTFKGGQYTTRTLDEDLLLYRRWGGESGELGPYWSRTNYVRAGNARRYSALPPGNTAEHITTIRVPAGTTIYEGRAAAQAEWGVPGGGSQVVFDEGFRVPGSWVQP
jgi:hypothetical protein